MFAKLEEYSERFWNSGFFKKKDNVHLRAFVFTALVLVVLSILIEVVKAIV